MFLFRNSESDMLAVPVIGLDFSIYMIIWPIFTNLLWVSDFERPAASVINLIYTGISPIITNYYQLSLNTYLNLKWRPRNLTFHWIFFLICRFTWEFVISKSFRFGFRIIGVLLYCQMYYLFIQFVMRRFPYIFNSYMYSFTCVMYNLIMNIVSIWFLIRYIFRKMPITRMIFMFSLFVQ